MTIDLVIRNGRVVDGTGGPSQIADVAVDGGRIVSVGAHADTAARRVIDAAGCVVSPGFIDPHTHLDAQLFWDPVATPTCFHGVTTVVMSNCGFGIAPIAEGDEDNVLLRLQVVEEIPASVTRIGVPVTWRTWPEFRDALGALPLGINVASYVPHSALRSAVLGDRAKASDISAEEVASVVRAFDEALEAGALGLSTSRNPTQFEPDGTPMSSRMATDEELSQLVARCGDRPWTMASPAHGRGAEFLRELDSYASMTRSAGARMSWNPLLVFDGSDEWRVFLSRSQELQASGSSVVPQVIPVPITNAFCFANNGSLRAQRIDGWGDVMRSFPHEGTLSERVAFMERADVRAALVAAGSAGTATRSPRFDRWRIVHSSTQPDVIGQTLDEAFASSASPVDALIDFILADRLDCTIEIPIANSDEDQVAELCASDGILIGLGDSGAHMLSSTSYKYPTVLLGTMVRDRKALSLEAAVAHLTSIPARYLGLLDRGELRPGLAADICVFDLDALEVTPTELRQDLPGGAARLFAGASGYRCVVVNGEISIENDRLAGPRAGTFLPGAAERARSIRA